MATINDTKHKLTDKEIVTSVDSDDTLFVNIDGALKQIAIKDALQVEGGIEYRVTAVEGEVDELKSNLSEHSYVGLSPNSQVVNMGQSYSSLAWKNGKTVTVKCCVTTGYMFSGVPIFNIPEGYRPKQDTVGEFLVTRHSTLASDTPLPFCASVKITTNGEIIQQINNEQMDTPWKMDIFATYTVA